MHHLCRMSILESSCITFPCLKLVGYCIHSANCTPLIPSNSGNLTSPKLFHQLTPPVNMNLQTDSTFQLFKWLCHFTLNVTIICKRCYCPYVGQKIECKLFQYLKKIITSNKTWCSRCLEDNNDLFNLTRLFARGQTNSIMNNVRNNGCVHSGLFYRIGHNKWPLILKISL